MRWYDEVERSSLESGTGQSLYRCYCLILEFAEDVKENYDVPYPDRHSNRVRVKYNLFCDMDVRRGVCRPIFPTILHTPGGEKHLEPVLRFEACTSGMRVGALRKPHAGTSFSLDTSKHPIRIAACRRISEVDIQQCLLLAASLYRVAQLGCYSG